MGLSWQQGPLAPGAIGRFLVPDPLPERLLFAEPLRRRMRVRFGGAWVADSEDVVLLHEPGRYPVAYFPLGDTFPDVLEPSGHTTQHRDLGPTSWYTVRAGAYSKPRADVDESALTPAEGQTFCPYKSLASYYDIAGAHRAAWSYQDAWPEVGRISGLVSFEPDKVAMDLDGTRLRPEPGQTVISHGIDRDLTTDEVGPGRQP